jgi:hypothetical protein
MLRFTIHPFTGNLRSAFKGRVGVGLERGWLAGNGLIVTPDGAMLRLTIHPFTGNLRFANGLLTKKGAPDSGGALHCQMLHVTTRNYLKSAYFEMIKSLSLAVFRWHS